MNYVNYNIYLIIFIIFIIIEKNKTNKTIIWLYKNPIFKLLFLFGLFLYGHNDYVLTIIFAVFYIYLGQLIQHIELLENI